MWCARCGQDVPAVASKEDPHAVRCLRCSEHPDRVNAPADPIEQPTNDGRSADRIRHVENSYPIDPPPRIACEDDWDESWSNDRSHPQPGYRKARQRGTHQHLPLIQTTVAPRRRTNPRSNRLCWLLLGFGVAFFSCGALLIANSLLGEREELWDLGAPLVLAGQATFLIGLVLQLDILWQQSSTASQTLADLDQRLSQQDSHPRDQRSGASTGPETTAHIHSDPESIAGPHLMLRDLQGRLEAFGTRLSSHGS